MPAETEWFANLDNPRTRRAYQADCATSWASPDCDGRGFPPRHARAPWRKTLETHALAGATIRCKLDVLSSLFDYLCERNAVDFNPVRGPKRPRVDSAEGKTPALGDHQMRLARCAGLHHSEGPARPGAAGGGALLWPAPRFGVLHLRVRGKGNKLCHLPPHYSPAERLHLYLEAAWHGGTPDSPLFQPLRTTDAGLTPDGV